MNIDSIQTVVWVVLAVALIARAVWVVRKYESQRVKRFIGWPIDEYAKVGKFYWKEGVFSSEVTRAMSPDYARRYRWLLSQRGQRTAVVLNVASWALCIFGAFDLSWNLNISGSFFSWWFLLPMFAYLLVRGSVRLIASAPDDLLDERQIALRNNSHRVAYFWLINIMPLFFGFFYAIDVAAAESVSADFLIDAIVFGGVLLIIVVIALPSMVLAWSGSVKER